MFVVSAGGARHCVFLLVNQTIHLGIAPRFLGWVSRSPRSALGSQWRVQRSHLPSWPVPLLLGLAVLFWLAGFDIIYSLQDRDFDRKQGLHSMPVRFVRHCRCIAAVEYFSCRNDRFSCAGRRHGRPRHHLLIGFGAVAIVLFWEHRIVAPNDLSRINRAFFDFNAYMSIVYFVATLADLVLISGAATALQ